MSANSRSNNDGVAVPAPPNIVAVTADFVVDLATAATTGAGSGAAGEDGAKNRTVTTTTATTKIAFGSCHKSKYADAQIWKTIAAERPVAFLWTGDAVYPAVRDVASVEQLEAEYNLMLLPLSLEENNNETTTAAEAIKSATTTTTTTAVPPPPQTTTRRIGYAAFAQQTPIFGTWDDHDYGGNDRGNDMPDREARAAAYWKFLNRTPPPPLDRKGLYYSVLWQSNGADRKADNDEYGRSRTVKAIFLDTRYHRQPHCIPSVAGRFPLGAGIACLTRWLSAGLLPNYCHRRQPKDALLGTEQWAWLEKELLSVSSSSATAAPAVLLVVSSIQVLTTNPAMESWGHFPAERDRLLRLLLTAAGHGSVVTVLSGDVHHGEILDPFPSRPSQQQHQQQHDSSSSAAFLEVTSSGLTHDCSKHIYGVMCRPLLELFSGHRRRSSLPSESGSSSNSKRQNYFIGRNYGTVTIDWEAATVEVRVHDVTNGTTVLTTGPRSLLLPYTTSTASTVGTTTVITAAEQEYDVQSVLPCMDGHLVPVAWTALLALVLAALLLGRSRRKPSVVRQHQK